MYCLKELLCMPQFPDRDKFTIKSTIKREEEKYVKLQFFQNNFENSGRN